MAARVPRKTSRRTAGLHPRRRTLPAVAALALIILIVAVGYWYFRSHSFSYQVRRGLELLGDVQNAQQVRTALEQWELETRPAWEPHTEAFAEYLFNQCSLDDRRIRLLLARVTGADYGDRRDDWDRWYAAHKRLLAGQQPEVSRTERAPLDLRWTAPVGLTAWFSTMIPLDGHIYVASLGANFDDPDDAADGVIRVDGATGQAEFFFEPPVGPGRAARDIVGLAAGSDCLFAACLNGMIYSLNPDGTVRWSTHVGSPAAGPPLSVDFNHDGATDVIVVTRAGNAVALSGQTGRTVWVTTIAEPTNGTGMLGSTLALTDALPDGGTELIATAPLGDVVVLSLRDGRLRCRSTLAAGTLAGTVCRGQRLEHGPPAYTADRSARVWSLVQTQQQVEPVLWGLLALRPTDTLVAGVRILRLEQYEPPLLLVCPTGEYGGHRSGICAVGPQGVAWRLPIAGTVWGTPAIADINGDREVEVVVASIEPAISALQPTDDGTPIGIPTSTLAGALTVVSSTGHCLRRVALPAPIECSPLVADVDGDNQLEVLVADQAGWLHCFATNRVGPVTWGSLGGDTHNTRNADNAYSFGQTPAHYQWQWQPAEAD